MSVQTPWVSRTISYDQLVIDRLFAPNAVRAAEEKRVADSSPKEKAKTRAKRATKEHSAQQGGLFGTPKGDDE